VFDELVSKQKLYRKSFGIPLGRAGFTPDSSGNAASPAGYKELPDHAVKERTQGRFRDGCGVRLPIKKGKK
jgi:hypothetical protein